MPAPVLIQLRALRTNVVRARFDVAPRALDSASFHDALNPRNWTVTRLGGGYAPPTVRVEVVDGDVRSVDVFVLSDLSADVDYDVVASAVIEGAPP